MEQGYRINMATDSNENERWHWSWPSYLPGQPTSGEWRAVPITALRKSTSIPREGDERDTTPGV